MPDAANVLPAVGTVLVVAVLGAFALGTGFNVRKGERTMRWLQTGLPLLGPRTTIRWLGSSVAELTIAQPRPPLRAATVLIVLEPRDLGALWLFSHARRRRDFLLVRLDLRRSPRMRADLVDPRSWTAGDKRSDDETPFANDRTANAGGRALVARFDDDAAFSLLREFWERIEAASGSAWRISVRPLVPHLEVHVLLPAPATHDARQLLEAVIELAEALSDENRRPGSS